MDDPGKPGVPRDARLAQEKERIMIQIDTTLEPRALLAQIGRLFALSGQKIDRIEETWDPAQGTPVFTVAGQYTTRGWTEWTQGFQFGSAILQFDATGEERYLELGREGTVAYMATHVSHVGVHDHGFNNVSTYGNLLRLIHEGRITDDPWERHTYELALKVSGAVQAARWTPLPEGLGYIYSFNGPHSLFIDTVRSLRALALAHVLGHRLMGEQDRPVSLLERLLAHAETTARYNVYWGTGRDIYDERGRTAHESIFNVNSGAYRCPCTQQGYSPFTTWTRGLAWAMCGYAEQIEFLQTLPEQAFDGLAVSELAGKAAWLDRFVQVARAVCDFYIAHTPADGIPYWDTGAPGLQRLGNYLERPADPYNDAEPVDSSAASIAVQGLLRLGRCLLAGGEEEGARYIQAGLTVTRHLFDEPYLSTDPDHQGLILHSIYHRPNGWDYVPAGSSIPCGESSMWGDYHARELALYLKRWAEGGPYYTFFA
jgi:unsaturated chondroitin disaccharide hydrolase